MAIQQLRPLRILLIGESCIDEYAYGTVTRISPEAPIPILKHTRTTRKSGMADNVRNNLEALGCKVTFLTNDRTEIVKRRFVDEKSNQQLLREDVGDYAKLLDKKVIDDIDSFTIDAVVISDYCKGLIDHDLAKYICSKFKGITYVDSKKADLSCFPWSYIKVNEDENVLNFNQPTNSTKVVTLGAKGSLCEGVFYNADQVKVHDVTGAGDVFLAALAYYSTKRNIYEGIKAATALATVSVQHFGTYTITDKDLLETGYMYD
jgi:bifunctional ADP-heptose synthase (sugar kinase/adenylyltransferase)